MRSTMDDFREGIKGIVEVHGDGSIRISDATQLEEHLVDTLIHRAVFDANQEVQESCRWLIRVAGLSLGIVPSSIQSLYEAMGREEATGFTVPAINIRGITYDTARAVFRAANTNKTGAVIFEIAKSEIRYTHQEPAEYAAVMTAAAIKEGFRGPLFIQGDHFQLNAKRFAQDPRKETESITSLIDQAIAAGFYNIDIDASTLVDLTKPTLQEQQRQNYEVTATLTAFIRHKEPAGITISVGGEIGEVGGKNSTVEELRAFLDNYTKALGDKGAGLKGISKISVQTGTTHGGVPLPDGTIAEVNLDFETLENLSREARRTYGLSGAVQHGASTLPDEAFHRFPETTTAEVHLATGFQNIIYESPHFPSDLKNAIYGWLRDNCAGERKDGQTEEQFFYKTRKKGFGPFKEELWNLPEAIRMAIGRDLENKFGFLFQKLNVGNTRDLVERSVTPVEVHPDVPTALSSPL